MCLLRECAGTALPCELLFSDLCKSSSLVRSVSLSQAEPAIDAIAVLAGAAYAADRAVLARAAAAVGAVRESSEVPGFHEST